YNEQWSSATLKEWLKQKLDAAGGRYTLDFHVSGESFLVPPGEVSDILATAIERVTGRKPELSTTGGTSDARFIHHHCPLAEFGLVGLTMHKVDERVTLADMAALTEIYGAVLELYFPAR
ncbi:MAG TPA: M20/M25/M40 family metallo-hydrolase, partial [Stellaceae bacterium]